MRGRTEAKMGEAHWGGTLISFVWKWRVGLPGAASSIFLFLWPFFLFLKLFPHNHWSSSLSLLSSLSLPLPLRCPCYHGNSRYQNYSPSEATARTYEGMHTVFRWDDTGLHMAATPVQHLPGLTHSVQQYAHNLQIAGFRTINAAVEPTQFESTVLFLNITLHIVLAGNNDY